MRYSNEEKAILKAYDQGMMKLRNPDRKALKAIQKMAESTFKKDKRITLRLYDHDFKGIQKKALELGIPYQTLISGLIHSYIDGELSYSS